MDDLSEYKAELDHDVGVAAAALNQFTEDAFFEVMTTQMVDAGELEAAERVRFAKRGLRVDGYGGPPAEYADTLTILLLDYAESNGVESLTATELEAVFKRGLTFLDTALSGKLRDEVDETSPAFDLVDLIGAYWRTLKKLRLCVITNKRLSKRVDGLRVGEYRGIPLSHSVWDLERSWQFAHSKSEREDIEVDFIGEFGGALPVLPVHLDGADYAAYLAVIPGRQLAEIYDRWGTRLLEQNVRVFLQGRAGVNKEIKKTIEQRPEMFFAYNNGISATAERVDTSRAKEGIVITSIHNLQIVNGGQTTASIHAALMRRDPGVDRVSVQMKLSIIPPEQTAEVVPKISEYANSQNKISAADFFSNHQYHVRMEGFSRRVVAPPVEGAFLGSKWFYERARGQFNDARSRLTVAARRKFDQEYPKTQFFTKTDLAKFLNAWGKLPQVVSKGAQKNFAHFAVRISEAWDKNPDAFNERYFQHSVAKAIAFRHLERLVTRQDWYEGGYRANIVAYSCAKLQHDVEEMGLAINFDRIWREQAIGDPLEQAMVLVAERARDILVDTPSENQNVTEWAKSDAPWERLKHQKLKWPKVWIDSLLTAEQASASTAAAVRDQKVTNEINALQSVVEAGAGFWKEVLAWGEGERILSIREREILGIAARMPVKLPTERQSTALIEALARLQREGFPGELPKRA